MSGFNGVSGDPVRDNAQQSLAKVIGNDSTRPRSIELAIRIENALYERVACRTDDKYPSHLASLVEKFTKNPQAGYEINAKLLTGMVTPEKWVEEEVPECEPEYVAPKPKASKSKPEANPAAAPAPSPSPSPAPASASASASASPSPPFSSSEASAPMRVDSPPPPAVTANNANASSATTGGSEQKSKTQSSNYYYFSSTDPEQAKQYAPKPIANPQQVVEAPVHAGVSKWNKGGTYEERNISSWAHERLAELLAEVEVPEYADGSASISSAWKVTGDVTSVFTRGKKRVGYELHVKATFSGTFRGKSVTGDVEIPELENTCGPNDYAVNVVVKSASEEHEVVRRAVMKAIPAIKENVEAFLKELLEK